jgi:tetratricopeptide (TPR) repeat protein
MRQHKIVGRYIVVGLGVIALACACYLVFEVWNKLDCIWGPTPLLAEAAKCLDRGEYDSALTFANRAVRCRPDFWITYYARAHVFEARGDFAESLRDYTKADSLGYYDGLADRYDTLAERGRVYEKMGEFDKAAAAYCEALRGGRNSNRSSIVRGVASHRVKGPGAVGGIDRHPDAVPSLLKFIDAAIERHPDNRDLRRCRELIVDEEKQVK